MKQLNFLLALVLFVILYSSCTKCGDDKKLGSINLLSSSKTFFPILNYRTLEFKNDINQVMKLESSGPNVIKSKLDISISCEDGLDRSTEYYESEFLTIVFAHSTNRVNLTFRLQVNNALILPNNKTDTVLYDLVEIIHQIKTQNPDLEYSFMKIFVDRGNSSKYPDLLKNDIKENSVVDTIISINNILYPNAIRPTRKYINSFLANSGVGVIAIQDENQNWWFLNKAY